MIEWVKSDNFGLLQGETFLLKSYTERVEIPS